MSAEWTPSTRTGTKCHPVSDTETLLLSHLRALLSSPQSRSYDPFSNPVFAQNSIIHFNVQYCSREYQESPLMAVAFVSSKQVS